MKHYTVGTYKERHGQFYVFNAEHKFAPFFLVATELPSDLRGDALSPGDRVHMYYKAESNHGRWIVTGRVR